MIAINLRPRVKNVSLPALILLLGLIPSDFIQIHILYRLWLPFASWLSISPFVYVDKPWYLTYIGFIFVAGFWALVTYFVLSLSFRRVEARVRVNRMRF